MTQEIRPKLVTPSTRGLFDTINIANMLGVNLIYEANWLLHDHILCEMALEKSIFDIQLTIGRVSKILSNT